MVQPALIRTPLITTTPNRLFHQLTKQRVEAASLSSLRILRVTSANRFQSFLPIYARLEREKDNLTANTDIQNRAWRSWLKIQPFQPAAFHH